uniref:acyl-coenzyme A thioesterase 6-like n=1 Tax=Semicossyphus pulcher TaxID=241346 RepID=UPI0037E81A82
MLGFSLGSSFTLKMAAYSKVVKLRCAVCIGGCHVQPVDGSLEQIINFFKQNAGKTRYTEEQQVIYRDLPLPIPTDPAFKVDMKEMMERAGNSHLLTVLSYPNAGHLIEPPYTLHSRASLFESGRLRREVIALWGGETVAHSHAQEDAWRKTLVFLRENLYRGTNPGAASVSNL